VKKREERHAFGGAGRPMRGREMVAGLVIFGTCGVFLKIFEEFFCFSRIKKEKNSRLPIDKTASEWYDIYMYRH
jgi:hypothetical protein